MTVREKRAVSKKVRKERRTVEENTTISKKIMKRLIGWENKAVGKKVTERRIKLFSF